MKYKKAKQVQKLVFEMVRTIGIRCGVLPKNFPKNVHLYYIDTKKVYVGGLGGAAWIDGKMSPYIVANLAFCYNLKYLIATYAHEILHVQQWREKEKCGHGNKFRKSCKKFSKALGVDYYLLNGYDAPSNKTAAAMGKSYEKWLLTFQDKKGKKKDKVKAAIAAM